jgi:hypothetical protein
MLNPSWLDEIRDQLKRQELPPPYVERLCRELSDHLHDIQEEKQGMDAEMVDASNVRMGEPSDLAQFIGSEFRKQSFSRKHPIAMFAAMPVLLLLGIWGGLYAGLELFDYVLASLLGESVEWAATESVAISLSPTDQLIVYGVIWVPVALTTVIFCRAARRRRVSWRWPLLTAATLAVFPGMTVRVMPSMILIGVQPAITAALLLQALLPLTIAGCYSWRRSRLERVEWAIDLRGS